MALKIRGESEFLIGASRDFADALEIAQRVVKEFQAAHANVLSADVAPDGVGVFQISIVLRTTSYAQAEDTMSQLSTALTGALAATSTTAQAGATELVPA